MLLWFPSRKDAPASPRAISWLHSMPKLVHLPMVYFDLTPKVSVNLRMDTFTHPVESQVKE